MESKLVWNDPVNGYQSYFTEESYKNLIKEETFETKLLNCINARKNAATNSPGSKDTTVSNIVDTKSDKITPQKINCDAIKMEGKEIISVIKDEASYPDIDVHTLPNNTDIGLFKKSGLHKKSSLTKHEQRTYIDLLLKFRHNPPGLNPSNTEKKDISRFEALQVRVTAEQNEFLHSLKEVSINQGIYSFLSTDGRQFTQEKLQEKLKYVESLPRYFIDIKKPIPFNVSNSTVSTSTLVFVKTLAELGVPPKISLPTITSNEKKIIGSSYDKITSQYPVGIPNVDTTKYNKEVCSKDGNCESLACTTFSHIVTCPSVLRRLVNNHGPDYNQDWEIPFTVKVHDVQFQGKTVQQKVVYMDKPLPPKHQTARDRNTLHHKYALRAYLVKLLRKTTSNSKDPPFATVNIDKQKVGGIKTDDDPFGDVSMDDIETFGQEKLTASTQKQKLSTESTGDPFGDISIEDIETFGDIKISRFKDKKKNTKKTDMGVEKKVSEQNLNTELFGSGSETDSKLSIQENTLNMPIKSEHKSDDSFSEISDLEMTIAVDDDQSNSTNKQSNSGLTVTAQNNKSITPATVIIDTATENNVVTIAIDTTEVTPASTGGVMSDTDTTEVAPATDATVTDSTATGNNVLTPTETARGSTSAIEKTEVTPVTTANTTVVTTAVDTTKVMSAKTTDAARVTSDTKATVMASCVTDTTGLKTNDSSTDNLDSTDTSEVTFVNDITGPTTSVDVSPKIISGNMDATKDSATDNSDFTDTTGLTSSVDVSPKLNSENTKATTDNLDSKSLKMLTSSDSESDALVISEDVGQVDEQTIETDLNSGQNNTETQNNCKDVFKSCPEKESDNLDLNSCDSTESESDSNLVIDIPDCNTQTPKRVKRKVEEIWSPHDSRDEHFRCNPDPNKVVNLNKKDRNVANRVPFAVFKQKWKLHPLSLGEQDTDSPINKFKLRSGKIIGNCHSGDESSSSFSQSDCESVFTPPKRPRQMEDIQSPDDHKESTDEFQVKVIPLSPQDYGQIMMLSNPPVKKKGKDHSKRFLRSQSRNSVSHDQIEPMEMEENSDDGIAASDKRRSPRLRTPVNFEAPDKKSSGETKIQQRSQSSDIQITQTSEVVKRKRGRPRKQSEQSLSEPKDNSVVNVDKALKRGKSKSQTVSQAKHSLTLDPIATCLDKRGENKVETEEIHMDQTTDTFQGITEIHSDKSSEKEQAAGTVCEVRGVYLDKTTGKAKERVSLLDKTTEKNKNRVSVTAVGCGKLEESKTPLNTDTHSIQKSRKRSGKKSTLLNPLDDILGKTESESQDTKHYTAEISGLKEPSEGQLSYHLWKFSGLSLIIRTSTHGVVRDVRQTYQGYIVPKLEYQIKHGLEKVSLEETCEAWISCYVKPYSRLLRGRIAACTSELLMLENLDLNQILLQTSDFNANEALSSLHNIFMNLYNLNEGSYLLCHDKGDEFCHVKQPTDHNKRGAYDLHFSHQGHTNVSQKNHSQWYPIDTNIILNHHRVQGRIPATYQPEDFNTGSVTGNKKKGGGKKKNKNKKR